MYDYWRRQTIAATSAAPVIARNEVTWQSPGTKPDFAVQIGEWYQEIATA